MEWRPGLFTLAAHTLRDPATILDRCRPGPRSRAEDLAHIAPRLLALAVGGAVVFGAVVGSFRGGVQVPFAAIKMPVLLLVPLVVGLPAVGAACAALDLDVPWRRLGLAGLVGAARTGVLATGAAPLLWLLFTGPIGYHEGVLVLALSVAALGLPGLLAVGAALPGRGRGRALATLITLGVLGLLTAQTGWLLRPFVARPTAEVAFLRPVEEDVFSSLEASIRSAVDSYPGWDAESAGFLGDLTGDGDEP